jgi:predicted glutamine amidotransferase
VTRSSPMSRCSNPFTRTSIKACLADGCDDDQRRRLRVRLVRRGYTDPTVFKSIDPTWNDANLARGGGADQESRCCSPTSAPRPGTPVQRSNCHPFRHGRWLWMHNGAIREFQKVKRDLALAVDPGLDADIQGSSDSETLFFSGADAGSDRGSIRRGRAREI